MQRIESLADSLDVDRIQLNAHNLAPTNMTAERLQLPFWVSDFGYQPGLYYGPNGLQPLPSLSTPAADQIVDLRFSEEHLFARLQESARRAVRKAEKHALGVRASRAMEDVPRYYELARRSAVRTGESLAPLEYFCRIVEVFQDAPRAMLLFVSHGDNDAAALLLLVYKQGATFLGGVSDPEYLEMRINDLLHWSAIRLLREQGVRYYRLGPWFPTVPPDWPIAKVSKFKSKFGGLHIPIVEGTKFRRPRRYLEDALQELRARYAGPVVACPGT